MQTPEQIAMELAIKNSQIIMETRQQAIEKAKEKGYTPDMYYFEDNISQIIDNPEIPYKLTLKVKNPTKGE